MTTTQKLIKQIKAQPMSHLIRNLQKQEKQQEQENIQQDQQQNQKLTQNQILMLLSPQQRKNIAKGKTSQPLISFNELQQILDQVQDTWNQQSVIQLHYLQDQIRKLREENWILKNSQITNSCIENAECSYIM